MLTYYLRELSLLQMLKVLMHWSSMNSAIIGGLVTTFCKGQMGGVQKLTFSQDSSGC